LIGSITPELIPGYGATRTAEQDDQDFARLPGRHEDAKHRGVRVSDLVPLGFGPHVPRRWNGEQMTLLRATATIVLIYRMKSRDWLPRFGIRSQD
jgi:hypothetical protein